MAPFSVMWVVEEAVVGSLVANSFAFPSDEQGKRYITMIHDSIMKNHPGRLQGKFSYKKVIRMLEVQHDTDGHEALRLYISKIFRRMLLYFSCSKHGWSELRTVNNIWHPFRDSPDNLTGPKPYSERKM